MRRTKGGAFGLVLATGLLLSGLAGCQIAGFVMNALERVPAAYEPENRRTVIVVDDPGGALPTVRSRGVIAQRISRDLEKQEVIEDFITPNEVDRLRMSRDGFEDWPIDRIGKETGAEQVIYVLIENFELRGSGQGHQTYQPIASARVKLVDVTSGVRLFPGDQETGRPVVTRMFYEQSSVDTRSNRTLIQQKLADRLAEQIGKLFYEHPPEDIRADSSD